MAQQPKREKLLNMTVDIDMLYMFYHRCGLYSPPIVQYRLPLTTSPPPLSFKFRICFFLVIYDSLYRRFPIPPIFRQSRERLYLGARLYLSVHPVLIRVTTARGPNDWYVETMVEGSIHNNLSRRKYQT